MKRASILRVCYVLLLLCIPASMLCVMAGAGPWVQYLMRSSSTLARYLPLIQPFFPTWPQYFAVQTFAALIAVGAVWYWASAGARWLGRPALNWRHMFAGAAAAYALWGGLSYLWSAWPYGTQGQVIRELPLYFMAVAAMFLCARERDWLRAAKVYAASALAAVLLQTVLIFWEARPHLPRLWEALADRPFAFAVPFVMGWTVALSAAGCLTAMWLYEDESSRRKIRTGFTIITICAAAVIAWFLIALDGTLPGLMRRAARLGSPSASLVDYHRGLRDIFVDNPLFFGNVNFSIGIALTGLHITVGLAVHRLILFVRRNRATAGQNEPASPGDDISTGLLVLLALAGAGVFGFLVVVAGSLAGRIAAAVSAFAYLICVLPLKRRWLYAAVPLTLAAAAGIMVLSVPGWRRKAWEHATGPKSTMHLRVVYWWAAGDMFLERPAHGWGAGAFPAIYPTFRPPLGSKLKYVRWVRPTHPHNEYARVLCELGLVGGLFYIGVLGFAFPVSYLAIRRRPLKTRLVGYGVWCGALAFAVQATFSKAPMSWTSGTSYWVILGLLAATSHWLGERPPPAAPQPVRIKPDAAVALVIVVALIGWGWWDWGVGGWKSQAAMSKASTYGRGMSKAGVRWRNHLIMREFVERERPRSLWPTHVLYHDYVTCWFLANEGRAPEARRLLLRLQQDASPDYLKVRLLLATCHAAVGDIPEAHTEAVKYLDKNPYDYLITPGKDEGAYEALAAFDLPGATFLLEHHLREDPEASEARLALARFYVRILQKRELLSDPQAYLAAYPYDLEAHNIVHLSKGRKTAGPSQPPPSTALARSYLARDLKAMALKQLEKYLDKARGDLTAYRLMTELDPDRAAGLLAGRLTALRKDTDELRERLSALDPPLTVQGLAAMLEKDQSGALWARAREVGLDAARAAEDMVRLLRIEKARLDAACEMARYALKAGDNGRAREIAMSVLQHDPAHIEAFRLLGEMDPAATAPLLAKSILRRFGDDFAHHMLLAELYHKIGERRRTLLHAREAHVRKRTDTAPFSLLAKLDRSKAIQELQQFVTTDPPGGRSRSVEWQYSMQPLGLLLAKLCLDQMDELQGRVEPEPLEAVELNRALKDLRGRTLWMLSFAVSIEMQNLDIYRLLYRVDPTQAIRGLRTYVCTCPGDVMNRLDAHLVSGDDAGAKAVAGEVFEWFSPDPRRDEDQFGERLAARPRQARELVKVRLSQAAGYAHVEALALLLRFYAEQGRWREAEKLVTAAQDRAGIHPYVLVVPAAAYLSERGATGAGPLRQLHTRFPGVFAETVPAGDSGDPMRAKGQPSDG